MAYIVMAYIVMAVAVGVSHLLRADCECSIASRRESHLFRADASAARGVVASLGLVAGEGCRGRDGDGDGETLGDATHLRGGDGDALASLRRSFALSASLCLARSRSSLSCCAPLRDAPDVREGGADGHSSGASAEAEGSAAMVSSTSCMYEDTI